MAYSDYTIDAVLEQFGLTTDDTHEYFANTTPAVLSQTVLAHLAEFVPLAVAISSEKARSELIIVPILMEARRQFPQRIGYFSGVEFSPAPEEGLRGVCDYLLSLSPEQLAIRAPVVALAEAKNENIKTGIAQCMAEMLAAQRFNAKRNETISTIHGIVTTGTTWQFMRLIGQTIYRDTAEYYIDAPENIVGILLRMLHEATAEYNKVVSSK